MAILFELSESIIKRAALISSEYSDRSLLSIIEECFEYGAKSLYPDSKKPLPVQRVNKPVEEIYSQPPTQEEMNVLESSETTEKYFKIIFQIFFICLFWSL